MGKNITLYEFYGEEDILKNLIGATITGAEYHEAKTPEQIEEFGDSITLDLHKKGVKIYLSFNSQGCWHYGDDFEEKESEITLEDVISQKDEEIKALKGIIARIQAYSTGAVYSFNEAL